MVHVIVLYINRFERVVVRLLQNLIKVYSVSIVRELVFLILVVGLSLVKEKEQQKSRVR